MKKSSFFIFLAFLFLISCSGGDDPLVPCITVSDCPDSSYSCLDGFCIHNSAIVDPGDSDSDTTSGDTLPDGGETDSGDTSDNGESTDDGENSELPDAVTVDDDETGDGDTDSETNDDDGETDTDSDTSSDNDGGSDDDADTLPNCSKNEDCLSNPNNIRCDTATGKCVMCLSDDDCLHAYGQSCDLATNECVSDKTCAAAIEKLPHGGKFDWEDGTTQGFSTNNYWDVVDSSLIAARSGSYTFGRYSGYSDNMDYTSVLLPVDLSLCSACTVNVLYYAKGTVPFSENGYDFIQPTCNGEGTTTARNSTGGTQSLDPQSPWETANGFYNKVNSYSTAAWTTSEWQLPAACRTTQFVFGLSFSSSSMVTKTGLVVDDLTIAPAATGHEPDGVFESADGGNVKGWTCDLDAPQKYILVKIEYYKNKDESAAAAVRWAYAKLQRPGDSAVLSGCSETNNHGFEMPFDEELRAVLGTGTHSAAVFAVDIPAAETNCSGTYKKLGDTKEFVVTEGE